MTRFARVGEGRKRPLEASQWKDFKKNAKKGSNQKSASQDASSGAAKSIAEETVVQNQEMKEPTCSTIKDVKENNTDKVVVKTNNTDESSDLNPNADKSPTKRKFDKDKKFKGKKFKSDTLDYSKLKCYNCHKPGHKVSDCPEPSDGKMADIECFKCKEKGHKAFRCPNVTKFAKPEKKKDEFVNPNVDFMQFQADFRQQWNKKMGFSKAIREAWKILEKSSGKTYHQFKRDFVIEWNQKTGYNKALRHEWKTHGKDLKSELRKQERSEERRQKRIEQRETEMHCFNCRGAGHQLSECPELKKDVDQGTGICFKCGSTEHAVQKCTVRVPDGQYPFAKCFICGENGHISKQCPDNPRGLYPNGGCCKVCGSVEHMKKDCPEMQKKQGIGSMTLSVLGSDKSADWEDIKQYKPQKNLVKTGPKIIKF